MNHYPHHIGDYLKDTAHLDPLEDGIYRRMIDLYYTQEGALPNDIKALCRRLRLDQNKHGDVLICLLNEFFILSEETDDWHHSRCDREIQAYQAKAEANRENGKRGGRPKKPTDNPQITQVVSDTETHKNLNQNQNHIKEAADAADTTIWDLGIKFLKSKGVVEKQARTILGSHYKADKQKLASVVAQMLTIKPIEPIAYLQKAMQPEVRKVAI